MASANTNTPDHTLDPSKYFSMSEIDFLNFLLEDIPALKDPEKISAIEEQFKGVQPPPTGQENLTSRLERYFEDNNALKAQLSSALAVENYANTEG